jgi:hypothetical protein
MESDCALASDLTAEVGHGQAKAKSVGPLGWFGYVTEMRPCAVAAQLSRPTKTLVTNGLRVFAFGPGRVLCMRTYAPLDVLTRSVGHAKVNHCGGAPHAHGGRECIYRRVVLRR